MGVYCLVHMCVVADRPLPSATRAAVVELARTHELLHGTCKLAVHQVIPPRTLGERAKQLFTGPRRGYVVVAEQAAGSWLAERVRELGDAQVSVSSQFPRWKGEDVAGHFAYRACREAIMVHTGSAYDTRRSPHAPPDAPFFDVLELQAKRDLDGKIAARSPFVTALKRLIGAKVQCRASWI